MALEHIRSIERLLRGGPRTWTEAAYHGPFVMGQGMPVFVVFARESLDVVLARNDWAFLGTLRLMSEHVSLEVLEDPSAVGVRASSLLLAFLIAIDVTGS